LAAEYAVNQDVALEDRVEAGRDNRQAVIAGRRTVLQRPFAGGGVGGVKTGKQGLQRTDRKHPLLRSSKVSVSSRCTA